MGLKLFSFVALYLVGIFFLVPLLAKPFGRVPLPFFETKNLQPGTYFTVLLCRNYVQPELMEATIYVSEKLNNEFPGMRVNYLDANFPFIDSFPLLPHLSHDDGKKLDVSFAYRDQKTGAITNKIPTFIGYGFCEEPNREEVNTALICAKKGYWQYSLLRNIVRGKGNFTFDAVRTRRLVNLFAQEDAIGKIFIEPHLKSRLELTSDKIRFHGCQAVRHDDHLHVQLK